MALTTLDLALAGMQPARMITKGVSGTLVAGRPHTWWAIAGSPGAGSYDTTLNGATLTGNSVAGQLPRSNPGAGEARIASVEFMTLQTGVLIIADRLWQNRIANSTGAQSITSPTWPARDVAGSTNGDGVLLGLELSTASSAGTPTAAITYTNSANTGSRTANLLDAFTATTAVGSFLRYDLQAGDTGVRSVQSINLSATLTGGVCNIVAYRPLVTLPLTANIPYSKDALTSAFPKVYDGAVLFFIFVPSTTTTTTLVGSYAESQG